MPEFVQKLEPPFFCEALALALEIPPNSFQLGRTKIFFKAGKGQVHPARMPTAWHTCVCTCANK